MVLTPRLPFDHVAIRDIIIEKRQSSTCTTECSASLAALNNPADTLAFCSDSFIDGFQNCMNCLAASGISSFDAAYFSSLKSSMDSIVTSCSQLGRPVSHSVTIPPLNGAAGNTGAATGTKGGNPPTTTYRSGDDNTTTNNNNNSSGPPIGAIVGGVVGGIAVIVGVALLIFFLRRRNNRQPAPATGGFVPTGPTHDPNQPQVGPGGQVNTQGYYPVPQSTNTPPPQQMQQYNNMGATPGGQSGVYNPNPQTPWQPQGPTANSQYGNSQYGNAQFGAGTSYVPGTLSGAQQQYGQPQMNMNPNPGFVAAAMHENRASTYAPSTLTTSTNAPYQAPFSPGPMTATSSGSQRVPSPPVSSNSPAPIIVSQQYPITESYTHANVPAPAPAPAPVPVPVPVPTPGPGAQVESPPAYEGGNLQPGAAASGPLSQAEVELISQRVASIMNANGQAPDAAHIGKLVGEQQRKN